ARAEVTRPQPSPADQIVSDYLALCEDPSRDLEAWAAIDRPAPSRQAAARAEVTRPQPSPADQIVSDYLALCEDPSRDLEAWAAIDRDQLQQDAEQTPSTTNEGDNAHADTYTKGPHPLM